jgi:hypothetical protein
MSWVLCVLMATLAWGQAQSAPPPQAAQVPDSAQAPADTSASVPADAPVITVKGICDSQPKPPAANASADCKTVITKAEFEKIVNAIAPNPSPQQKKQLANVLPRLMAMSSEARSQGMDKTEQYAEILKFAQMQILQNQLQRKLQEDAANISDADIEKNYKDNAQNFEQYNLDRIFVPRTKQIEPEASDDDDKEQKLTPEQRKAKEESDKAKTQHNEEAMAKLADDLRARAAAGEDVTKLQKEAFDKAGMKIESPNVNLPTVRRNGLPAGHAAAFDLKPGEVSAVIHDAGGYYIYKMNGAKELPLDQVKNEIHSKMQQDRMREKMEQLNTSFQAETNEAYFGPASASPMPPPRPRPRLGMPPAGGATAKPQTPPPAQTPAPQKH